MKTGQELRESLSHEDVKQILFDYQVYPIKEDSKCIIYPTACHNLDLSNASPKLFYYKENKMFVCYTECSSSFDIFELIRKMERLRGREISFAQAVKIAGCEEEITEKDSIEERDRQALNDLIKASKMVLPKAEQQTAIDENILAKYSNNKEYLWPWITEGIDIPTLQLYGIKYSISDVAIVIPHRDKDGRLIGIRGRFMSEEATNKYMPLNYKGQYTTHSLSNNLYGIYENKEVIKKRKIAILFESEKSVMKYQTAFGSALNFSVATCGNKISLQQIGLLRELGVEEVVLCYDKDYKTYNEMLKVQERYNTIGKLLSGFFKVSVIMDTGMLLDYKDSPIDQGGDVFKELYKHRYYI